MATVTLTIPGRGSGKAPRVSVTTNWRSNVRRSDAPILYQPLDTSRDAFPESSSFLTQDTIHGRMYDSDIVITMRETPLYYLPSSRTLRVHSRSMLVTPWLAFMTGAFCGPFPKFIGGTDNTTTASSTAAPESTSSTVTITDQQRFVSGLLYGVAGIALAKLLINGHTRMDAARQLQAIEPELIRWHRSYRRWYHLRTWPRPSRVLLCDHDDDDAKKKKASSLLPLVSPAAPPAISMSALLQAVYSAIEPTYMIRPFNHYFAYVHYAAPSSSSSVDQTTNEDEHKTAETAGGATAATATATIGDPAPVTEKKEGGAETKKKKVDRIDDGIAMTCEYPQLRHQQWYALPPVVQQKYDEDKTKHHNWHVPITVAERIAMLMHVTADEVVQRFTQAHRDAYMIHDHGAHDTSEYGHASLIPLAWLHRHVNCGVAVGPLHVMMLDTNTSWEQVDTRMVICWSPRTYYDSSRTTSTTANHGCGTMLWSRLIRCMSGGVMTLTSDGIISMSIVTPSAQAGGFPTTGFHPIRLSDGVSILPMLMMPRGFDPAKMRSGPLNPLTTRPFQYNTMDMHASYDGQWIAFRLATRVHYYRVDRIMAVPAPLFTPFGDKPVISNANVDNKNDTCQLLPDRVIEFDLPRVNSNVFQLVRAQWLDDVWVVHVTAVQASNIRHNYVMVCDAQKGRRVAQFGGLPKSMTNEAVQLSADADYYYGDVKTQYNQAYIGSMVQRRPPHHDARFTISMCMSSSDERKHSEWNLSAWTVTPLLQHALERRRTHESMTCSPGSDEAIALLNGIGDVKPIMTGTGYGIAMAASLFNVGRGNTLPRMIWFDDRIIAIQHTHSYTLYDTTPHVSSLGLAAAAVTGNNTDSTHAAGGAAPVVTGGIAYHSRHVGAPFSMGPLHPSVAYVRAAAEWILTSLSSTWPIDIFTIIFSYFF